MRRWCFTDISGTRTAKNCYCFTWEQLCHLVCNQLCGHGYCLNLPWECRAVLVRGISPYCSVSLYLQHSLETGGL